METKRDKGAWNGISCIERGKNERQKEESEACVALGTLIPLSDRGN